MDLRQHLKRVRAKPKTPFSRDAFTAVGALVREHGLDESFLESIRDAAAQVAEWVWSYEPRPKEPLKPPLFALVDAEEFQLIQAILAAVDNPYAAFAHTPDELLASGPLFHRNPDLPLALLERVHLRTLLAREFLQAELGSQDSSMPQAPLERLLDRLNEVIAEQGL
jgi:hypothetical protein